MITDLVEFRNMQSHVADLDDAELIVAMRECEARQREEAAREAAVLAEIDRRGGFAADGHASMWGLLRKSLGWSDGQCRVAMRIARLCDVHPDAGDALLHHESSVANIGEIARAAANPRIGDQIDEVIGSLLRQAERQEHDVLCVRVRTWEKGRDRDHEHQRAQTAHERRTAQWDADAVSGELVARLGPLDGLEVAEILAAYEDAEWRADWDAVVAAHGDGATSALMPRTAVQRRADAVVAAIRDGASRPPGSKPPEPVVNVHVDHHTYQDIAVEAGLLPERDVDPFDDPIPHVSSRICHTTNGAIIDHRTVLQLLLGGYVRWVIHNDEGHVVHWGRAKRLFEGAARDAARSLSIRCTAPGCRVPTTKTETDHVVEYARGGLTDPDNAAPACKRHNLLRHNRRFTVWRDALGDWHTYRADGTEVQ